MSSVTNYILITEADSDFAVVRALNEQHELRFVRVDHHAGGPKAVEWCVYMAATNHRPEEEVVKSIFDMPWSDSVQLMVAAQDDEKWRIREP